MARQHVDFVDNENFETVARWSKANRSDDRLANIFHLSMGGRVDLLHVDRAAFGYLTTGRTCEWIVGAARRGSRSGGFMAIKGFSQKPCGGGFPHAPRAGKEVGMMEPLMLDGVTQGPRDWLLAGDFVESLRARASRKRMSKWRWVSPAPTFSARSLTA